MKCLLVFCAALLLSPTCHGLRCCNTTRSSDGRGISLAHTPTLSDTQEITLCLWVSPEHDEVYDILNYRDKDSQPSLYISTREVIFEEIKVADLTDKVFNEGRSTYICVTWKNSEGLSTFINGKLLNNSILDQDNATAEEDTSTSSFTELYIGSVSSERKGLVGSVCGVTLWSTALSGSDVESVYRDQNDMEQSGYKGDSASLNTSGKIASPSPAYSWKNFTHHNYTSINTTYCFTGKGHGIRLGSLDPVASKFVILFLVIIGVVIGFAGLFMCSEREIAIKRAQKRLKDEENYSIDNVSTHSVT